MDLTVSEAAEALGKSSRAVRYMIQRGKVRFHRKGHLYLIDSASLPMSLEQQQVLAKKWARSREVIDQSFPQAPPLPTPLVPERTPVPQKRYSLRGLNAFCHCLDAQIALQPLIGIREEASGLMTEALGHLREGGELMAVASYSFDANARRINFQRARDEVARALATLELERLQQYRRQPATPAATVFQSPEGISPGVGDAGTEDPLERLTALLETSILPALGGLMQRASGSGGTRGRRR